MRAGPGRSLDDLWTFICHNPAIDSRRTLTAMPTEPTLADRPPAYRSYLLRLWEERGEGHLAPVWRFSLEDPQTTHRQGFATLAALTHWLQAEIDGIASGAPPAEEAH
jgi:hypothetical protein